LFNDPKAKALSGLTARNTWRMIYMEDLPPNPNILGGRFVLSIKYPEPNSPIFNARFVCQGHKDRERNYIIHTATTLKQSSTRLISAVAALGGYKIWSDDVHQAYLQADKPLGRRVFLRPPAELKIANNTYLELLKPLYGIPESGDLLHATFSEYLKSLGMKTLATDPSFFVMPHEII
jgi:hypothetical protein